MNAKATPPLIVDLELWSPPGSSRLAVEGKDVAAQCHRETGLPPDVVLGLNFVPDEQDVARLLAFLEAGKARAGDFIMFCEQHGLPANTEDVRSAAEYLAHAEGQPLAWLHFPAEPSGFAMAQTLLQWARQHNLLVRDGGYTNDLLSDSQVYAHWQGAA